MRFLTATNKVEVVEGEYRARIEHTDDYPSLDVEVVVNRQALRIGSQSQQRQMLKVPATYVDRTPWRIDSIAGRSFTSHHERSRPAV